MFTYIIKFDHYYNEFVVIYYYNKKRLSDDYAYYTDCSKDAKATAESDIKRMVINDTFGNVKLKLYKQGDWDEQVKRSWEHFKD